MIILDFRTYGLAVPPHLCDFIQAVMPARGIPEMDVDGRGGRVDTHHAALIPADATHVSEATGANRFIVFGIPGQTVDAPSLDGLTGRVFFPLTPGLHAPTTWLQDAPIVDAVLANARSSFVLTMLAAHPVNQAVQIRARPDARVERAWHAIEHRYAEPLTVDALVAEVGVSACRLATLFRATYGIMLHAHLAQVWLRHALTLLETTALPIAEIAVHTGYYDQSALTRHLKVTHGVTPAAARR